MARTASSREVSTTGNMVTPGVAVETRFLSLRRRPAARAASPVLRRVLVARAAPALVPPTLGAAEPAGGVVHEPAEGVLGVAERLGVAVGRLLRRLAELGLVVLVARGVGAGKRRGVGARVDPA